MRPVRILLGFILAVVVLISCVALAVHGQQQPTTKQPSTEDQLAIVRIRAQILDAQARMQQAQQVFEKAQKDSEELQPRFSALMKAIQVKLPPPAKGKVWQPQDDKQMGVAFVEVDDPTPSVGASPQMQTAGTTVTAENKTKATTGPAKNKPQK